MVYLTYLKEQGFKKDEYSSEAVNRWELTRYKKGSNNVDFWCSITLDDAGSKTRYGVINFHTIDCMTMQDYIYEHRSFIGELSIKLFENFSNQQIKWKQENW